MEAFSKGFLHHGVDCEMAVEVDELSCRVLAFVKGVPVYDVRKIQSSELEGVLLTAEQIVPSGSRETSASGIRGRSSGQTFVETGLHKTGVS